MVVLLSGARAVDVLLMTVGVMRLIGAQDGAGEGI